MDKAKKLISNFRSKVISNIDLVNFGLNILTFYTFVCLFAFFPLLLAEKETHLVVIA